MREKDYFLLRKLCRASEIRESFIARKDQFEIVREKSFKKQSPNGPSVIYRLAASSQNLSEGKVHSVERSDIFALNFVKLLGESLFKEKKIKSNSQFELQTFNEEMEIPAEHHNAIVIKKDLFERNQDRL